MNTWKQQDFWHKIDFERHSNYQFKQVSDFLVTYEHENSDDYMKFSLNGTDYLIQPIYNDWGDETAALWYLYERTTQQELEDTYDEPFDCSGDASTLINDYINSIIDPSGSWWWDMDRAYQDSDTYKVETTVYYRWTDGSGNEWENETEYDFNIKSNNSTCYIDEVKIGTSQDTLIAPAGEDCSSSSVYTPLIVEWYKEQFPDDIYGYQIAVDSEWWDGDNYIVVVRGFYYPLSDTSLRTQFYDQFTIGLVNGECEIINVE